MNKKIYAAEAAMPPIEDLSELAAKINEASDQINELLKNRQTLLQEQNLGIEVFAPKIIYRVREWRDKGEQCEEVVYLGWAKLPSGWRITALTKTLRHGFFEGDTNCPYTETAEESYEPVLDARREIRVAALENFEWLVSSLKEKGESVLNIVAKAAAVET